jgi:hypothetical protein
MIKVRMKQITRRLKRVPQHEAGLLIIGRVRLAGPRLYSAADIRIWEDEVRVYCTCAFRERRKDMEFRAKVKQKPDR